MTERDRRDFLNLLARGRGLPPVYDLDADDAEAIDALVRTERAAEPIDPRDLDDDRIHDARERAIWRTR